MGKAMKDNEELATMRKNFRSLRKAHGWTIEELSKISGIRVAVLSNIEEAGRDFDVLYLVRLCNLYHIKPAEIFTHVVSDGSLPGSWPAQPD